MKTDEWLRLDGDSGEVGISDYAQDQLNDIVFLELPAVGASFAKGAVFGVVESVKAASDMVMPVGGTVTEVNSALEDDPEQINAKPYESWLIKITLSDPAEAADLMDAVAYESFCETR
jgi:glycine cleavage system H protein